MRFPRLVASLFLFVTLSTFTLAQSATTSLRGTLTDPKGAVVSGASVTLSDPATGFTRTTTSDSQGAYQFLELPPATYVLSVNAPGFATVKQTDVKLMVNVPATINVPLQVSGGTVTLEVTGEAPLVNTTDATLGHAFGAEQIANLPFEGRDPTGILSLQPGVVFTGNSTHISSAADSRSGSVNGARSDQTNVTLDGVDNNDQLLGTAFQGALRVPLDSLQEFRVTTSNSDADAGRSSGGQVSLITKSGTNNIHGTVYEYHRPTFTTANDWFNKASQINAGFHNRPPKLVRNTFGASVGGPIIKDRLFWFAAYEGQRKREDMQVTRVVPSANFRNGIVSYPCDTSSDPNCPASGVFTLSAANLASLDPGCNCPLGPGPDPAVMQIFQKYPMPNTDTVGDGFNYRGFTFASPLPAKLDSYVAKLDYNLTASGNHRLFLRGVMNNDQEAERSDSANTITGDGGSMFPGDPANQTLHNNSKGFTAGYTATFSNTLINNFRFGYIRQGQDIAGLQTQHFVHFRGMDDINAFTPTTNTSVPVLNFVDDITKVKGNHTLQFGGNLRQVDNERRSNNLSFFEGVTNVFWLNTSCIAGCGTLANPSLDPDSPAGQAQGFASVLGNYSTNYDFAVAALAGLVTQVNSNYQLNKQLSVLPEGTLVPRHFRTHELEFYGQDQWRLKPNLTVTYGLRYTLLQPPYETTGTQVAPDISLNQWFKQRAQAMYSGNVYNPVIGFNLAGQANGKAPYWAWDYKDIAPRFALAYSPRADNGWMKKLLGGPGKTSIRAGYGIYYDHFGEGITNTFDRNGSFGLTTGITNAAGIQTVDGAARFSGLNTIPAASALGKLIEPPPQGPYPVVPPTDINAGGFAITWGLDDRLKTPYSHVVDFSITRELPSQFVFEASYVGRFARRLLQEEDLAMPANLIDPKSGMTYFQAAQAIAKQYRQGVAVQNVAPVPFWENVFPAAAGPASSQLWASDPTTCGLAPGVPTNLTATQAMYELFACFGGNETTALEIADVPGALGAGASCFPACATINGAQTNGLAFWSPQWSSLYAWRSTGSSGYNGAQLSLRHAMTRGLQFDFNYTFSKSIDVGSNAERINEFEGFGFASQVINSWFPNQLRAVSDFDTTHAINSNWVYELPVGQGKRFGSGASKFLDAIVGGWTISGLWRWSTGYPFSLSSGSGWATNFQLQDLAVLNGKRPATGSFSVPQSNGNPGPNVFRDPGIADPSNPNAAINQFRAGLPGESGQRNELRGPGTFSIDTGISKSWRVAEGQALKFTWQVFNVTNTPRFDVGTMQINGNNALTSSATFGDFSSTLSNPRVMEFALRYTF